MKNILFLTLALFCAGVVRGQSDEDDCFETPGFSEALGTYGFATNKTWVIGAQMWSDAVEATKCQKTTFDGNTIDCRSNPDHKGNLFSWHAVNEYKATLCLKPWRVPTTNDFIALDIALGGTGMNNQQNLSLRDKYLSEWGGDYGRNCNVLGALGAEDTSACYWSQSEDISSGAYLMSFNATGYIYPQVNYSKNFGFAVRCLRTIERTECEE